MGERRRNRQLRAMATTSHAALDDNRPEKSTEAWKFVFWRTASDLLRGTRIIAMSRDQSKIEGYKGWCGDATGPWTRTAQQIEEGVKRVRSEMV